MAKHPGGERASRADRLRGRLLEAARLLDVAADSVGTPDLAQLLLVRARDSDRPAESWLVYLALSGAMPGAAELARFERRLRIAPRGAALAAGLDAVLADAAAGPDTVDRSLRVVESGRLVEVPSSVVGGHSDWTTATARRACRLWLESDPTLVPVTWTDDQTAFRTLTAGELTALGAAAWRVEEPPDAAPQVVVPWLSDVLIPASPFAHRVPRLLSLARSSGNRVSMISDAVVTIAGGALLETRLAEEAAQLLAVLKHCERVVTTAESVATALSGFVAGLSAQGLRGPAISFVPLPTRQGSSVAPAAPGRRQTVVCAGDADGLGNLESVLFAFARLLRQGRGLRVKVVASGSRAETGRIRQLVAKLGMRGSAVEVIVRPSTRTLRSVYGRARFSVMLPLTEVSARAASMSISAGAPVVASAIGARTAGISRGTLAVDPRDDEKILAAIEALLDDDALVATVLDSATETRNWDSAASDLYAAMIGGAAG